jgi:Flp pilus assembly protein TadG
MLGRSSANRNVSIGGYSPRRRVFLSERAMRATATSRSPFHTSRTLCGQAMVEFALIAPLVLVVMVVGIQYALIGQAALALSQGASALARYAAVHRGQVGPNGAVTLNAPIEQLLSSTILNDGGKDLSVTIASYTGTTTTPTSSPQYTDRLIITLSYDATKKVALPNPFLGISFPTNLSASDSQMYE